MGDVAAVFTYIEAAISQHPALTVLGAVALIFIKPLIDRWLRGLTAWRAITREATDICRHLGRNAGRLDEMRDLLKHANALPVRIHIQKLAVPDRSMLFSDKALEDLAANRIAIVLRARVRLRNFNIDVAEALRVLDADDVIQFNKMLAYLAGANGRLHDWSPMMLTQADIGGVPVPIVDRPMPPEVSGARNSPGRPGGKNRLAE